MLRTLRNLIVNIIAAFIPDRYDRHKFRNKYKRKSKFRKLRDDNKLLFRDIKNLHNDILILKKEFIGLKQKYNEDLTNYEREKSFTFRVAPIDNIPPHGPETKVFLAITCVAKNEGPYLKEWIEYHKLVGVERFYFYDNESDDNTKEVLEPYINNGTVVYHLLPNHPITKQVPQVEAYNDAIFKYRSITTWMAMIDIDEFIVPVEKSSIPEFLIDYEQYPGVVVNWVCFDSNGHDKAPISHGGMVIANYTRVRKNHNERTVKSIVNPKQVVKYISPHHGVYYFNFRAVTENLHATIGQNSEFESINKIRINHYRTKSKEEYISKINRNRFGNQNIYKFNEGLLNFTGETEHDLVIQKYVPKLKIILGIKD